MSFRAGSGKGHRYEACRQGMIRRFSIGKPLNPNQEKTFTMRQLNHETFRVPETETHSENPLLRMISVSLRVF